MARANRAYHKFFEGYSEYSETDAHGRKVIRRVYTGQWYSADQQPGLQVAYRICYAALFALSLILFLRAASLDAPGNLCWYPTVPVVAAVFCYLWQLRALCYYLPTGKRTVYHHRTSSLGLQHSAIALSICMGSAALLHGLFLMLDSTDRPGVERVCLFLFLASGAVQLLLWQAERQVPYQISQSTEQVPDAR